MYSFEFVKAASLQEAEAADGDEVVVMAGGQTLIPTLKQRLASHEKIVDLSDVKDLKGIKVSGGTVTIGAMTTHAEVAANKDVAKAIPALAALAEGIGDPAVRNRGTIGGSIANNDPAADYPAAVVGLGATVTTNKREIAGDDFFEGLFETALDGGEIVTSVSFPVPKKAAYSKFPNPASRYAIVGVFTAETKDGARVAVTGARDCVFRIGDMESALGGKWSADAVADISIGASGLNADIHASAEYRAHLVTVMAKRAVAAAN